MKSFMFLSAVIGALLVTGCSTNRGGTADDVYYETDTTTGSATSDLDRGWSPRPDRTTGPVIPPP